VWAATLIAVAGCGPSRNDTPSLPDVGGVRLLTLTTLESEATGQEHTVRALVQPGGGPSAWFRFELYEFVPLDANPRGKRIVLWPEIQPGAVESANRNWRPHLKAYEFVLPVRQRLAADKTYLLEVTALGADGIRRTDAVKIKAKSQ
jgi:hypothetical protein